MGDRWMDERDRQMRDRDWRRSETFGRGEDSRSAERRSWQGRHYRGVSPAMDQDEYEASRPEPHLRGRDLAYDDPGYADDIRSRNYLSPGGSDYESGYRSRPHAAPDQFGPPDEDRRESFMYRAGERVASWLGLDRDGQPRSHRGKGPSGYRRSDERIAEDVHERLTEDHYLDASNINVAVSDGEVTLAGAVETREDKHRAERLVERISGVHHVQNNLRLATGGASEGVTVRGGTLDRQAQGEAPGAGPFAGDRDKLS